MKPQFIAYYLPQYHPTEENDLWWGKGFTEWTNVAKAKSLYRGHVQPKIPADLGFYDLRIPEVRKQQAELAKEAGISAFCYWHYWFGNGKKMLNKPFEEVVQMGEPDIPFCLAWANHSWYNKTWTQSHGHMSLAKSKLLVEQTYPGEEDIIAHFNYLLPAFKDPRYYKVHDKLLFVIFAPFDIPNFEAFSQIWNRLAHENGLSGFYFVAHVFDKIARIEELTNYDAINVSLHHIPFNAEKNSYIKTLLQHIRAHFAVRPQVIAYKKAITMMDSPIYEKECIYPTVVPNWDHTPRSGNWGRVFQDCTPQLFKQHVINTLKRVQKKNEADQIIFVKSWNEWGEGNYMEPDLEYGKGYITAMREAIIETQKQTHD